VLIFSSCNILKTVKLMKAGEVIQNEFVEEIPFEYRLGLIILKVEIDGNEYDFILDTGAPNVISKELAQKINTVKKSTETVGDSQNNESDLELVQIDKISIGSLDFTNTGAVVSDINNSQEVRCLNIDGFIGSNLMKKAIWKFDYRNQIITITHSMDAFDLSGNIKRVRFFPEITGTPLCDVKVNGQIEKNVVIDLGSNGDIALSNKTYDKVAKNSAPFKSISTYGRNASGLYGAGAVDTTKYMIANTISFGDVTLNNPVVEFSAGASTIGMNFFKNYDLIINWNTKELILQQLDEYNHSTLTNLDGFSWMYKDGKLVVSSLTKGGMAEKTGLQLNDKILKVNGEDYSQMSSDKWCQMLQNPIDTDGKNLDLVIWRDGKELNFILKEEILLE
jgi:predicted aspartyl protease